MPRLVAMARSGEAFVTSDDRHGLWLHMPPGAGGAGLIDEASVERAVAYHDFTRIDRDFETWAELDEFRQREAAKFAPPVEIDPAELDAEDVRDMLGVARRWATEGEAAQSNRLVRRLLTVPAAVANTDLLEEVVAALSWADESSLVVRLRQVPTDTRKSEARRRYMGEAVAA